MLGARRRRRRRRRRGRRRRIHGPLCPVHSQSWGAPRRSAHPRRCRGVEVSCCHYSDAAQRRVPASVLSQTNGLMGPRTLALFSCFLIASGASVLADDPKAAAVLGESSRRTLAGDAGECRLLGGATSGRLVAPGTLANRSCTFTVGASGAHTTIHDVVADGEPVGLSLSIFGACLLIPLS